MNNATLPSIVALALAALAASPLASAGSGNVTGTVTRVLVMANGTYGGCMAKLSVSPTSVLPLCGSDWVSFSCSGDFTDPVRAYRMLDQAQLALATGKKAWVQFTDASLHNGYCFAQRIDIIK